MSSSSPSLLGPRTGGSSSSRGGGEGEGGGGGQEGPNKRQKEGEGDDRGKSIDGLDLLFSIYKYVCMCLYLFTLERNSFPSDFPLRNHLLFFAFSCLITYFSFYLFSRLSIYRQTPSILRFPS